MPDNSRRDKMSGAKSAKKNEFYTLYEDIEKELNNYIEFNKDIFRDKTILLPCDDPEWSNFTKYFVANFNRFGLKKLISTSYANDSKNTGSVWQPSLFEIMDPQYDEVKSPKHGKIFTLTRKSKNVNKDDLKWKYLEGDGDFRSDEVKRLRDEADVIITNPPFTLFREFLNWINEAGKLFLIIGNINCITYKEVFPLIKKNKIWLGTGMGRWISGFIVPDDYELYGGEARINEKGQRIVSTNNCLWLTNLDHGKRHEELQLMSLEDNLKFNKSLSKKCIKEGWKSEDGKPYYPKYDNLNAIEVPMTEAIPKGYDGLMGVPITFLDKYNPMQFEIVGFWNTGTAGEQVGATYCEAESKGKLIQWNGPTVNKKTLYFRIIIKWKKGEENQ